MGPNQCNRQAIVVLENPHEKGSNNTLQASPFCRLFASPPQQQQQRRDQKGGSVQSRRCALPPVPVQRGSPPARCCPPSPRPTAGDGDTTHRFPVPRLYSFDGGSGGHAPRDEHRCWSNQTEKNKIKKKKQKQKKKKKNRTKGTHPYLFVALTLAPMSTRYLTTARWPCSAAQCSAVNLRVSQSARERGKM